MSYSWGMQMSFNGSGTFVINSTGQPVVTGTIISSSAFNALTADLATGLTTTLTKDGQTTPTANIPMGTFKITGMGAGTSSTDAVNLSQLQNSTGTFLTVTGTDTIAGTVSPSLTAYAVGQIFAFVAAATNTGAATINISSLGAKSITRLGATALVAGDLIINSVAFIVYDGTQFQLLNPNTFTNIKFTGNATFAAYTETITASGTVGASATLSITLGTVLTATLTSATPCTFTMPTATAGKSFVLLLKQPSSGSATTATFTGVKWNSGGAPTITATVGKLDILAFVSDGTNWYGIATQGYTY
jgi:hypothetical protein